MALKLKKANNLHAFLPMILLTLIYIKFNIWSGVVFMK